jgi:hypothetical protein
MKTRLLSQAIITIVIMLICATGYAQTKVYRFTYDGSGNREKRQFIQLKSGQVSSEESIYEDVVNQLEIKIYPNPTKGIINVKIPMDDEKTITLQLLNINGSLLQENFVTDELTIIDLSGKPSGLYILRIRGGDESSEWKILKE